MHGLPPRQEGVALNTPNACPPAEAAPSPLADGLRAASACTLGLVLVCGPLVGGMTHSLALTGVLGLLLAIAGLLWLASGAVAGELHVRFGWAAGLYVAFLAFAVLSSVLSGNWFAGIRWCLLMGAYGLAAFLTLQLGLTAVWRRFLLACLAATAAALAVYAVWHYGLYMPALRRWLAQDPGFVLAATGAEGGVAGELAARVRADRAYGSFITPNQMACFLAMAFFPLAGLLLATRGDRTVRAVRTARIALVAGLFVTAAALLLSRSKGGAVAFAFGMAVFAAGMFRRTTRLRRHRAALLAAVAVLLIGALGVGLLWQGKRLGRSFEVRAGYWRASVAIARERPLLGVGPDSWPEWYAMQKQPEDEESRAAHSVYFQLLAETGVVGLLLWCAAWAALLAHCARRAEPEAVGREPDAVKAVVVAPALAAVVLMLDATFLGTLAPPLHVPAWLANAPWLPYALAWVVWAAVFAAALAAGARARRAGVAAGLTAFLIHSAGDFTLRVPAIGLATAVLAGLLLSGCRGPEREMRLRGRGATALLAAGVALTAAWSGLVTRPALTAALALDAAEVVRLELVSGRVGPRELPALAARATEEYARACRAVPWDDRAWRERASAELWLAAGGLSGRGAADAVEAAQRAVRLNPLRAANWCVLSQARRAAGDAAGALDALTRAADLQPSLPAGWYAVGSAMEEAGRPEHAEAAYRLARELLARQYHRRNRAPAGPAELARFWRTLSPGPAPASLVDLAREIVDGPGGTVEPATGSPDELASLVEGLEGSRQLLRDWPALDARARERRLYEVMGERLWELALGDKVRALEKGGTERPSDAQMNGASGGT